MQFNREQRWRLVLGNKVADNYDSILGADALSMDAALEALYNSPKKGGLGNSVPKVNRWLGDIRKYFPSTVVQLMQKDALEHLGLKQMLLEPELLQNVEADVHLVSTLLSLNQVIPTKTKKTARAVVQKVVDALMKKLQYPLKKAIDGALLQKYPKRRPKYNQINWPKTIQANLKHFQAEYNSIIPHQLIGYAKKGNSLKNIILCIDQSGSMSSSVVYSSIFAAVLASMPTLQTKMYVFDTKVVDMSDRLDDPVELLFGTQLGGGTDINKALQYAYQGISKAEDTILILISDLYEGGRQHSLLSTAQAILDKGVQMISLLALNDEGAPIYDKTIGHYFDQMGIPVFACTPDLFPEMLSKALQKDNLKAWMAQQQLTQNT
jgi:hypothetical protein